MITSQGNTLYTAAQSGALIYITDVSAGDQLGQRIYMDTPGYYYFDGTTNAWIKLGRGIGSLSQSIATQVWNVNAPGNTNDPNALVNYGPFTIPVTGWYQLNSRFFYNQNIDPANGGNADNGSGHVLLTINSNPTNIDTDKVYEFRFSVNRSNYAVCPPSGTLAYLKAGTSYWIHQLSTYTQYVSTGERALMWTLLQ